jgi:hypothetical protein
VAADLDYDAVVGRIVKAGLGVAAAGLAASAMWKGLGGALSFGAGAAVSGASFYLLHRLVRNLGRALTGGPGPGPFSVILHGFRFFLLGGAAYAIVRFYDVFLPAFVAGLLVPVTAATLEALYELTYART